MFDWVLNKPLLKLGSFTFMFLKGLRTCCFRMDFPFNEFCGAVA